MDEDVAKVVGPVMVDHIGIACTNLDKASRFWRLIGLGQGTKDELISEQGVTTRFFATAEGKPPMIELLEPTSEDTPIGRFIAKKGTGVQQVCFSVGNLQAILDYLHENGIVLINRNPVQGAGGKRVAFVHPKSTGGVLVELTERLG